jgi:hypothetical protein
MVATEQTETPAVNIIPLAFEVGKLSPVAGDVLVLQCPTRASHAAVMEVLHQLVHILPEGVSVAALDQDFKLMMCNVPEFIAMINKPEVSH